VRPAAIYVMVEAERMAPVVRTDVLSESEERRLGWWLREQPALGDLVRRAQELAAIPAATSMGMAA
jgi:hypothetical protein